MSLIKFSTQLGIICGLNNNPKINYLSPNNKARFACDLFTTNWCVLHLVLIQKPLLDEENLDHIRKNCHSHCHLFNRHKNKMNLWISLPHSHGQPAPYSGCCYRLLVLLLLALFRPPIDQPTPPQCHQQPHLTPSTPRQLLYQTTRIPCVFKHPRGKIQISTCCILVFAIILVMICAYMIMMSVIQFLLIWRCLKLWALGSNMIK